MNIKKRDSDAILNSLAGGVVPSRGLHHIMVGRTREGEQIINDLESVEDGASVVKFFIGDFGSGKSFIQALIKQMAFRKKFVVTNGDFTPERRLYGSERKAVAIYSELMKNLSIATKPEGNALGTILEKWINDIQMKVVNENGYEGTELNNPLYIKDVETEIQSVILKMEDLTGGFDFIRVLTLYFKGFVQEDPELQRSVLKWIRGEYLTKTDARQELGVRGIVDDSNYYQYLKVIAVFIRQIGYQGLVVNFDEAINLYKITHSESRKKNYETILKMYNDTLQGNVEGLYITFSGTKTFLEDERKGLYSYGALKRRLEVNQFETEEFRDLAQPVIKLIPLDQNDTFVLLRKLRDIHATHYKYETFISDEQIVEFLKQQYAKPGATEFLTVGHIIRAFLGALNLLHQNPNMDSVAIFDKASEEVDTVSSNYEEETRVNVSSRFSRMED
ncbi:biotin carboxylase [Halobacillus fulvus]|nr:biotin carboxylase [Halobacillus fulvus]